MTNLPGLTPRALKPLSAAILLLAVGSALAQPKLNVVASLPDLAALAREIGGQAIQVTSLATGLEDPHFVDPKPSFVRVLNRADLLLEGGAELEVGWLPPLVDSARNPKIRRQGPGNFVAAEGVRLLQVPTGPLDRAQGDVHPLGNPHFLLAPDNCSIVARRLAETLSRLDPTHAAIYQTNLAQFQARLDQKVAQWRQSLAPFRGTKVVTYHKSFDYFLDYFGLELVGTIEPKPGIEPTPAHINELIPKARQLGVKLVIIEPNRPRRTPERVAQAIGAQLVILPLMPGGQPAAKDFFGWFDYNVTQLVNVLKP
jgi:zinc/manganese transport system substrate-binding protein